MKNWKEIKCPKCKESMQVPKERNRIICMFCGQEIFLDQEKIPFSYEKFPLQVKEALSCYEVYLARFSYEEYPKAFPEFCERYKDFFEQVEKGITQQETSFMTKSIIGQVEGFVKENVPLLRPVRLQYQLNSFVAVYFIPAIIHTSGEDGRNFCTVLGQEWAATFAESRIKAADYETIFSGFKRKLCYITTAACLALGKEADCQEVRRLKEYRDRYLIRQPGGEALLQEYYNIAPTIVKRIEKTADKKERYLEIWNTFLYPCLLDLEQGKEKECKEKYQEMIGKLFKEYVEGRNE